MNREILVTALGVYGVIHANEANSEATEWETSVDIEVILRALYMQKFI